MKRTMASAFFALTFTVAFTTSVFAHTIGKPDVQVLLVSKSGKVIAKTKTDKNGDFSFPNVKVSSDYFIKIDAKDKASIAIDESGVHRTAAKNTPATANQRSADYYLEIKGTKGLSFTDNVKAPRDVASGQSSGKRTHHPVKITTSFDGLGIAIDEPGVQIAGRIFTDPHK